MSDFVKLTDDELQVGLDAVRRGEMLAPDTIACIIQNALDDRKKVVKYAGDVVERTLALQRQVRVGVSVFIWKDGKLLLGSRKGSHGAGQYSVPGGHHDYGEKVEACALREVAEECGPQFKIRIVRSADFRDLDGYPPKQYVDCAFVAEWVSGEPKVMEPNKCDGWDWYAPSALPEQMFGTVRERVEEGVVSPASVQDKLEALLWPALIAAIDYNDYNDCIPRGFGNWAAWTDTGEQFLNKLLAQSATELRVRAGRVAKAELHRRLNQNPASDDRLRDQAHREASALRREVWRLLFK